MQFMAGKAEVGLLLPPVWALGYRLYMVGWEGGATGRVDLCRIIGYKGDLTILARSWCWSRDKFDEDLAFLSLAITPSDYPLVTAKAIPDRSL